MRFFADNPRPQFRVGEQVRISEGPFAPFSGVIEEIDDELAHEGRDFDLRAADDGGDRI
jgi:heat shock protein HspQ